MKKATQQKPAAKAPFEATPPPKPMTRPGFLPTAGRLLRSAVRRVNWGSLPDEIWLRCLGHLSRSELIRIFANKNLLRLGTSPLLPQWKYYRGVICGKTGSILAQPRFTAMQDLTIFVEAPNPGFSSEDDEDDEDDETRDEHDETTLDWSALPNTLVNLCIKRGRGPVPGHVQEGGRPKWLAKAIEAAPAISSLMLSGFFFYDFSQELRLLRELHSLCLVRCFVDDATMHALASLPNLEHLILFDTSSRVCTVEGVYSPTGLQTVLSSCTSLKSLEIGGCFNWRQRKDWVFDGAFQAMQCTALQQLCIANLNITDAALLHATTCAPGLQRLFLDWRGCRTAITHVGIIQAIQYAHLNTLLLNCVVADPGLAREIRSALRGNNNAGAKLLVQPNLFHPPRRLRIIPRKEPMFIQKADETGQVRLSPCSFEMSGGCVDLDILEREHR